MKLDYSMTWWLSGQMLVAVTVVYGVWFCIFLSKKLYDLLLTKTALLRFPSADLLSKPQNHNSEDSCWCRYMLIIMVLTIQYQNQPYLNPNLPTVINYNNKKYDYMRKSWSWRDINKRKQETKIINTDQSEPIF